GRKEDAIDSYDKAIEFKPDDHQAWYSLSFPLSSLKRYEAAIDSLEKFLSLVPDDASAFYNQACYYALWGEPDEALARLAKAIEQKPEHYRKLAKEDKDFTSLRDHPQFQALLQTPAEA
ncbi:MAG: tetratricopeptide repeat protein, partial [Cyanobacteria bacterium J06554_6]